MRTSRQACALFTLATALLTAQSAAAQDRDDDFRNGLRARGDKRWAEVAVQMRRAIRIDANESPRKVRVGFLNLSTMEYLPHFFLGEALFNTGDCAGAVTEWAESQR